MLKFMKTLKLFLIIIFLLFLEIFFPGIFE